MTRRDIVAALGGAALATMLLAARSEWGSAHAVKKPTAATQATSVAPEERTSERDNEVWRAANANLAETVRLTQQRLEKNEAEKVSLKAALREAQVKLTAATGGGAPPRNEFDLTQDDWKELAKEGKVKARYPCTHSPDWHLDAEQVASLGLSPDDAVKVEKAFADEQARIASSVMPGCGKILGSTELADKLGPTVCEAVISASGRSSGDAQLVSNIKAGNVPMPSGDSLGPMASLMLAKAGAMEALQSDLASSFGPEEAHRLAFADELGSCTSSWGGGPPKH